MAVALVAASFHTLSLTASTVRFDGVTMTITYRNGSALIFGPPSQNACDQTFPIGSPTSHDTPDCPAQLVGGNSYDFAVFWTGNNGEWPGLWVNLTVTAPFNFTVNPQTAASIPTVFSPFTDLFQSGGDQLFDSGNWWSWNLVFTFPYVFPSPSGGLWLTATLTVDPTNQTIGR